MKLCDNDQLNLEHMIILANVLVTANNSPA
jgi:hypothetical protein